MISLWRSFRGILLAPVKFSIGMTMANGISRRNRMDDSRKWYSFVERVFRIRVENCLPFIVSSLLILVVAEWSVCYGQDRPPFSNDEAMKAEWHFRHELFQMLFEERGLATVDSVEDAFASPEESVVVLFGPAARNNIAEPGRLFRFLSNGGAALLASDRAAVMGVSIQFATAPVTSDDDAIRYQGFSDLIRVKDLNETHPLTNGLKEIVVNRAGWLTFPKGSSREWDVVARVPEGCQPEISRGKPLIAVSENEVVGLKGIESSRVGTLMVSSDPSLFSNSMLWHGDNSILAIRVSEMLCRGGKSRIAMVVDGRPLRSYRESPFMKEATSVPPPPVPPMPSTLPPLPENMPKPTWENLLKVANSVVRNVEESNILNEVLMKHPRYPNRWAYPRVILLFAFIVMVVTLLSALARKVVVQAAVPASREMKTSRQMSSSQSSEMQENGAAAQTLARELCRELTGSNMADDWKRQLIDSPDASLATLSKAQQRELKSLVELAAEGQVVHISARQLMKYGEMIGKVRELSKRDI